MARVEAPIDLSEALHEKLNAAGVDAAIGEYGRIHASRGAARVMKVLGTTALYALGLSAAITAMVASSGLVAPTAAALMLAAETSGAAAGILGTLIGVGAWKEAKNKGDYKKIRRTFWFTHKAK